MIFEDTVVTVRLETMQGHGHFLVTVGVRRQRYGAASMQPLTQGHAQRSTLCIVNCSASRIVFSGIPYALDVLDSLLMVAVRTRTLHGGVDQKRETTPVLQNCSVLAVDGIDGRYRVRRKEPEGRVQTHQARRVSGGGDAGVWMR